MSRSLFYSTALAFTLVSCGEAEFGFKDNPVNLAVELHKAIIEGDVNGLAGGLSRVGLCVWGNAEGLQLLRKNLPADANQLEVEVQPLTDRRLEKARFVGYWSYYEKSFTVQVLAKDSRTLLLEATTICDFGVKGVKNPLDRAREPLRYPEKHCRVTGITPRSFEPLPVPAACQPFNQLRRLLPRMRSLPLQGTVVGKELGAQEGDLVEPAIPHKLRQSPSLPADFLTGVPGIE